MLDGRSPSLLSTRLDATPPRTPTERGTLIGITESVTRRCDAHLARVLLLAPVRLAAAAVRLIGC